MTVETMRLRTLRACRGQESRLLTLYGSELMTKVLTRQTELVINCDSVLMNTQQQDQM